MKNVLIMGAPRTGTSLLTSLFEAHGWDIGSRTRDAKDDHDPPRFEDPVVVKTNNQLLSWNEMHPMLPGNHIWGEVGKEGLEKMVEDKTEPWVMKDPGLCLTLSFWKQHFDECHIVATLRHPVPMIESLRKLNHFSHRCQPMVWWRYVQNALTWDECYGNVSWVHFPTLRGLPSAIHRAGGEPSRDKISGVLDESLVHGEECRLEPQYRHLELLYERILKTRVGR